MADQTTPQADVETFRTPCIHELTAEELAHLRDDVLASASRAGESRDFRDAPDLKRLAEAIYQQGGIVSAVCHGNAALVQLQGADGKPLISGRRVTGFSNFEEQLSGIRDQVPFYLQDAMGAAGGKYEKAFLPFTSHVVTDGRLVTGQNPQSSKAVARQVLALLQPQAETEAK